MGKIKLNTLNIEELLNYEKGCNIICKYYENAVKTYDGRINTNSSEYKKFQEYNNIRIEIVAAISKKVNDLEIE